METGSDFLGSGAVSAPLGPQPGARSHSQSTTSCLVKLQPRPPPSVGTAAPHVPYPPTHLPPDQDFQSLLNTGPSLSFNAGSPRPRRHLSVGQHAPLAPSSHPCCKSLAQTHGPLTAPRLLFSPSPGPACSAVSASPALLEGTPGNSLGSFVWCLCSDCHPALPQPHRLGQRSSFTRFQTPCSPKTCLLMAPGLSEWEEDAAWAPPSVWSPTRPLAPRLLPGLPLRPEGHTDHHAGDQWPRRSCCVPRAAIERREASLGG